MSRLRNIKNSENILNENKYFINEPMFYKGKWNKKVFKNNNPIFIEIGSGKGKFICEMAKNNPQNNYIAIDKFSSILVKLIKKINLYNIDNLRVILYDAKKLNNIFKKNEVRNIYLNFSDPWPKKRHEKRRLTHIDYLKIYKKITSKNSKIEFKTDNINLFLFTLNTIEENRFTIINKTFDLEKDHKLNKYNIETEYEIKFKKKGFKINKVIFLINRKKFFYKIF